MLGKTEKHQIYTEHRENTTEECYKVTEEDPEVAEVAMVMEDLWIVLDGC